MTDTAAQGSLVGGGALYMHTPDDSKLAQWHRPKTTFFLYHTFT